MKKIGFFFFEDMFLIGWIILDSSRSKLLVGVFYLKFLLAIFLMIFVLFGFSYEFFRGNDQLSMVFIYIYH